MASPVRLRRQLLGERILVERTGGTIEMVQRDGQRCPATDSAEFEKQLSSGQENLTIDSEQLCNIDSSNAEPSLWTRWAKRIYQRLNEGCAGVVVTCGTDTMAFTSAALAFALGPNLSVPVILTGAQALPSMACGDAAVNLTRAFHLCSADLAEVVICFGESVLRGSRADKVDEKGFQAFDSPGFQPLGRFQSDGVVLHHSTRRRSREPEEAEFRPEFASDVFPLSAAPGGTTPELLNEIVESPVCRGIFLASYGAGNVPTQGRYSVLKTIERASKLGKPVVLGSQISGHPTRESVYETSNAAVAAGAIRIGNMTTPAAYVKLCWALAWAEKDCSSLTQRISFVGRVMDRIYCGEMDPPDGSD